MLNSASSQVRAHSTHAHLQCVGKRLGPERGREGEAFAFWVTAVTAVMVPVCGSDLPLQHEGAVCKGCVHLAGRSDALEFCNYRPTFTERSAVPVGFAGEFSFLSLCLCFTAAGAPFPVAVATRLAWWAHRGVSVYDCPPPPPPWAALGRVPGNLLQVLFLH